MAKLYVTDKQPGSGFVEIRWVITEDDGSNPKNDSGRFKDQEAIDAAFKNALVSYAFSSSLSQKYDGKVVSLDNKGDIKIEDKPAVEAAVEDVQP